MKHYNFYDLLELYKVHAKARGFSLKTIRSTETNLKMVGKFFPLKTKVKNFSEKDYEEFLVRLRSSNYSAETIYDLNATLRKLVNLGIKKGLVRENPFLNSGNISLVFREDYRLVSKSEFLKIQEYFRERGEIFYEFLFSLLYFTGVRIGEALALRFSDFEMPGRGGFSGGKVLVNKSFLYEFNLEKEPKNKKVREIPIPKELREVVLKLYKVSGGGKRFREKRVFPVSPSAANEALKRVAKAKKIPEFHCHSFRHTYISNLIRGGVPLPVISYVSGDTQKTILKRYSHMFGGDEKLVLKALEKVR